MPLSTIFQLYRGFKRTLINKMDVVLLCSKKIWYYYTPAPRRGRGVYCFTSVRPRYFSSHFSQELLMTQIWYLVTIFISVPHIVTIILTLNIICSSNLLILTVLFIFLIKSSECLDLTEFTFLVCLLCKLVSWVFVLSNNIFAFLTKFSRCSLVTLKNNRQK
jgi:hypothetical protein